MVDMVAPARRGPLDLRASKASQALQALLDPRELSVQMEPQARLVCVVGEVPVAHLERMVSLEFKA